MPGLTDPADQGPGADQAGGVYKSGKKAIDLAAGHIVVCGIFGTLLAQNAEREHPNEVDKYHSLYNVIHSAGSFLSNQWLADSDTAMGQKHGNEYSSLDGDGNPPANWHDAPLP